MHSEDEAADVISIVWFERHRCRMTLRCHANERRHLTLEMMF